MANTILFQGIHYIKDGIVIRIAPQDKGKYVLSYFLDIDELDADSLEDIGKVCANFGLATHDNRFLISLTPKEDYSEDSEKVNFVQAVAALEARELYSDGHKTVFDLFHDYYTSTAALYRARKRFFGRPSLEESLGNDIESHRARLSELVATNAPLQGFFLHHLYQRYATSSSFDFLDNEDEVKEQILNDCDLYAIAQFLLYTESHFFSDTDFFIRFCREKIRGLPSDQIIRTYSSETNGILGGEVTVPKTEESERIMNASGKEYYPEVLFPELFDTSEVKKVFGLNPVERSYLLNKHPEIFDNLSEEKLNLKGDILQRFPNLDESIAEVLLESANYFLHMQIKSLS